MRYNLVLIGIFVLLAIGVVAAAREMPLAVEAVMAFQPVSIEP